MDQPVNVSSRHRGLKVFLLLCALMIVALPAMAAKGGSGATGGGGKGHGGSGGTTNGDTISLKMVTDVNGNGSPDYGDTVTFNAYSPVTPEPHVRLQCVQNGTQVLSLQAGMYPSYLWPWLQNMTLSWSSGGAADCTAQIYYFVGSKTVWSTSLKFPVDA